MKLVIFDIDGTLSDTNEVDNSCFNKAFYDVLSHSIDGSVWDGCEHITDLGLTHHIYQKRFRRLPRIYEVNRIKNALIGNFEQQYDDKPELFREVQGAVKFFHLLKGTPQVAVAIATGCWRESAVFKLDAIGLDHVQVPFGHSDQQVSRSEITKDAIEQAKIKYRCTAFDKVVYIGDGTWDLETAKSLRLQFVGIDCKNTGVLQEQGAESVFNNFDDSNLHSLLLD